jgi:hypothetical protein
MRTWFCVEMQAIDPDRNCWRAYRVGAGRDLFGCWIVEVTFGRTGSGASHAREALEAVRQRRAGTIAGLLGKGTEAPV